jgi:hypothetical protein
MVSFPMEIYDAIMEEVDDSSQLCLIAQTARLFRPRAQRLIYRNIKLDISIRRTITVFKLLCGSPRLASYVHELNAAAFWYSEHGPCDYAFFSPVLRLLSRVLRNVINLRQLHLNSGLDRVPFSILRGELCHFKLHSLVTYYNPTENTLSGFIVQQTSIRRLEFRNASFSIKENFPPNVLPNLSVFMGNIVHAVRLIQHRPITHLFVTSTNPNPLAMSNLTALSSLRVKCIGLDANISSAILASLPQTFPSLEVLIFRRTDERNVSDKPYGASFNSLIVDLPVTLR